MKYFVCNFKNKLTKDDVIKYNNRLSEIDVKMVNLVIVPSLPFLTFFDKNGYSLGSQDISSFMDKTITGEVTGEQLKSLGVEYVIVGHSERREYKHEINIDFINKINNAIESGIKVIYCIGETLKDKEDGNTYMVLEKQISEVLNNVEVKNIIIAYEPVWAIGTGKVPSEKEIKDNIEFIKDIIEDNYDTRLDVLYGGSINKDNIASINAIKGVDGFLVGGASTSVDSLESMLLEIEK